MLEYHVKAYHGNVECHKTITLTTLGEYSFLTNLIPLVKRWKAPISVAVYAPDEDYIRTMKSIARLRNCGDNFEEQELIKKFISFHPFFEYKHMPKEVNTIT